MTHPGTVRLAICLVLFLAGGADADFEFASADLFRVRLAHATEPGAAIGPTEATAFELLSFPGMVVGRWRIPFRGKDVHVFVALVPVDATTSRWRIAVVSYGGLPTGWRLEAVEQRFPVRQTVSGAALDDRLRLGIVYGPTSFDARSTRRVCADSPTFLQTQQVTITNGRDGLAASLIAADPAGHRKAMGFSSTKGNDVRVLIVEHHPENHRNHALFLAPTDVLFRNSIPGGIGGAIRWYRDVQKQTPGSFLLQRQAIGLHPHLKAGKFSVATGPVLTARRVGTQYDVTEAYVAGILEGFGGIHGPGLIVYHIGWYDESTTTRFRLYPNLFDRVLPGCAKLIAAARKRSYPNVAYLLPALVNTRSPWFKLSEVRRDRGGKPRIDPLDGELIGEMCWDTPVTRELLAGLIVDVVLGKFAFDGGYLDALCATYRCHDAAHNHAEGCNEQLAGIVGWLARMEARIRKQGGTPFFAGETPTEIFPLHMSGLDLARSGDHGRNLFRRTYSAVEWPCTHLVLAYHPLLYPLELARGLAEGARPTVVWPEYDGVFPKRVDKSPAYAPFVSMLRDYCRGWDHGFRGVIEGRALGALPDFVTTEVAPIAQLRAIPRPWTDPVPAVFHGVFAPTPDTGERTITLVRWTTPDANVLNDLAIPVGHPLLRERETVTFSLSRAILELDDHGDYEVWIRRPGDAQGRRLGRLPKSKQGALTVKEEIEAAGLRIVTVRPIGS